MPSLNPLPNNPSRRVTSLVHFEARILPCFGEKDTGELAVGLGSREVVVQSWGCVGGGDGVGDWDALVVVVLSRDIAFTQASEQAVSNTNEYKMPT